MPDDGPTSGLSVTVLSYGRLHTHRHFAGADVQLGEHHEEEQEVLLEVVESQAPASKPMCSVIYAHNPPKHINSYDSVRGIFKKYGKIIKIYVNYNTNELFKVYFSENECAFAAYKDLNNVPPHNLQLKIVEEKLFKGKVRANNQKPLLRHSSQNSVSEQNNHSSCVSIENGSSNNSMNNDVDIEVVPGKPLYDIFGREVEVYECDEMGKTFVSLEELKKHDFELFMEEFVPKKLEDKALLQQLTVYIGLKVRKFLKTHAPNMLTSKEIDSIVEKNISRFTSGKPLTPITPKISNQSTTPLKPTNNKVMTTRRPVYGISPITVFTYSVVELEFNTPITVSVCHPISDRRCFVYVKSHEEKCLNIVRRVQQEAMNSEAVVPEIMKIYAAQFKGDWHRVVVAETDPIKVRYIDYGNDNEEPITEVRRLSKALCEEPAEAICINFGTNPSSVPLEFDAILNIIPFRKNSDRSYQVKEAPEPVAKKLEIKKTEPLPHQKSCGDSNIGNKTPVCNDTPCTTPGGLRKPKLDESERDKVISKNDTNITDTTINLKEKFKFVKKEFPNPNTNRTLITNNYQSKNVYLECLGVIENKRLYGLFPYDSLEKEYQQLEELGKKIATDSAVNGNVGDTVAVFHQDEDKWTRGTIIKKEVDTYSVALIDYGVIINTETVKKLPKEFEDIPEFCCVCLGTNKFYEEFKTGDSVIIGETKIRVPYNDGTTETIECHRWSPLCTEKTEPDGLIYFGKPKEKRLKSDEIVKIVDFDESKLYVRTKDCTVGYDKLVKAISEHTATPLKKPPQLNQLVLCPYESGSVLYRAIVTKIEENSVEVNYFDVAATDSVKIPDLKSIPESLVNPDVMLMEISLRDVVKFDESALNELQKVVENQTKYKAEQTSSGKQVFDLISTCTETSLSQTLKSLGRFMSSQLPKVKLSSDTVTCMSITCEGDEVFFLLDDDKSKKDFMKLCDITCEDKSDSYVPIVDELCLALYEQQYSRARVLSANEQDDSYEVYFIDFGNTSNVSSKDLRKLNEDLQSIVSPTISCKVNNEKEVTLQELYIVKILSINDEGVYLVDLK